MCRAYLGVVGTPAPVPADVAERHARHSGVRMVQVVPGSPAARAGLRAGDLVLDVGRHPVQDAHGIQKQLFGDAVGVLLPVTVLRNGAMVDVAAVPTELGQSSASRSISTGKGSVVRKVPVAAPPST